MGTKNSMYKTVMKKDSLNTENWRPLLTFCIFVYTMTFWLAISKNLFLLEIVLTMLSFLFETILRQLNHNKIMIFVSLFWIFSSRTQLTQGRHVQAQVETSHSTRSVSGLGLLCLLRMWTLIDVQLGGVATPSCHPQIFPQAMTVFQWLLRMWWELELQEILQHSPSVSWSSPYSILRTQKPVLYLCQGKVYCIPTVGS